MNSWLFKKLHISWLVAAWCLGLTIGVISIHYIPRSFVANSLFLLVGLAIFCNCGNLALASFRDFSNYFWSFDWSLAR